MPEEPRVVAPTKALLERADAREAALRALVDAESSAQRREHIAALQREFEQLSNLPSHKAFGWAQRRENHSAARLQSAWRRRSATRAFKRTVRAALASRREQAAAAIQRAQRTKHRTVFETAPPVSQEMVAEMSRAVMTLTLERAHELKEARKAIAKAKEADPGATRLPPLPAWWVQSGSVPRETIAAALNDWVLSTYETIADELNKLGAVGATYSASFPSSDAAAANCHLLPQVRTRAQNALTTRAPIALCPPCLMPAASRAACAQVMYTRSCDTVLALESLASDFAALMRAHNDSLADVDLDSVHVNPATVVNPIAVDDNCTLPVSALNARSKALLERAYRTDLTELGYEPEPALTSSCSATKRKVTGSSTGTGAGAIQQVSNIIKGKQICASEVVRFSLHDL